MNAFWTITLAIGAMVAGNLSIRAAMIQANQPHASLLSLWRRPQVILGSLLLSGGFIVWIITANQSNLEWSYVALGLSYIITIVCAWWFMGETLTLEKMFGAIILVIGTMILIRNSGL